MKTLPRPGEADGPPPTRGQERLTTRRYAHKVCPMHRTYKYQLLPNAKQERALTNLLSKCASLYNGALEERIDAYRKTGKTVTLYDQMKSLTIIRSEMSEWSAIPAWIARSPLRRLDHAYKAFFRRVKAGEKPGFPRFRSRARYDSFSFPPQGQALHGNRIHVPKLGHVKFNLTREISGEIKEVTIRRSSTGRWWVCFSCDLGEAPPKIAVRTAVGIDVGLESFATLTDGSDPIQNPRYYRKGQDLLARRQRVLARKRKGSNARRLAKLQVAKAYEHVCNQRRDFSRKLAADLCARYDLIAHEDLNIRGMVHGNLSKSIHDAAWGQFLHDLSCKAESAGKHVIAVDPRGTSQRCSACGSVIKKDLGDRQHVCVCGLSIHRDLNAARNILALGLSARQVPDA